MRGGMRGFGAKTRRVWRLLLFVGAVSLPQNAAAAPCDEVQKAIDARATVQTPADVLLRLGPHFGPGALPALLEMGKDVTFSHRIAAYGAFGLARHAEGLQLITAAGAPRDPEGRLGHALATLALGADTDTGTVADAMTSPDVVRRRNTMWVLSRMMHVRPRRMLYAGLRDRDSEVRLTAAEALIRYRSRSARRILLQVIESGPSSLRPRALEALIGIGHRFRRSVLKKLNPDDGARAFARGEGRPSLSELGRLIGGKKPGLRAGALAVAAAHPDATPKWLARVGRKARRFNQGARGELAMAGALLGDEKAQRRLPGLEGRARAGGLRVLVAFAETPSVETRIDTATADRVAAGVAAWWPTLTEAERARVLKSLGAIDAPTSVRFVRRVLGDTKGAALAAAAVVLSTHGSATDALALLEVIDGADGSAGPRSTEASGRRAAPGAGEGGSGGAAEPAPTDSRGRRAPAGEGGSSSREEGATLAAAARLCRLEKE